MSCLQFWYEDWNCEDSLDTYCSRYIGSSLYKCLRSTRVYNNHDLDTASEKTPVYSLPTSSCQSALHYFPPHKVHTVFFITTQDALEPIYTFGTERPYPPQFLTRKPSIDNSERDGGLQENIYHRDYLYLLKGRKTSEYSINMWKRD